MSALIWPNASRVRVLAEALEQLVRDPSIAVRTCAAGTLTSVYRHDEELAISLFHILVDTDDVVLATPLVERFISLATRNHLKALKPILLRMLGAGTQACVRQAADKRHSRPGPKADQHPH